MSHRNELLSAYHLEIEDLEANRAGTLSNRQAQYLKLGAIRSIILTIIIIAFLAAVLFGVATKPLVPIQWILTSILCAIVFAIGFQDVSKSRLAVADQRVECLLGPARIQSRGRAGWYLAIAHRDFKLPVHQRNMRSEANYRVYIAPKANCIVAIEPDGWD
jgi:hypothetical protein